MPDTGVLARLRAKRPLVHCISNIVTANDCANLLLAAGASPMMAEAPEEMAEITAISDSTVLNMGTPAADKYSAARVCIEESKRLGKPFVLDPVGVGASAWRLDGASSLLSLGSPDILRVNLAEAEAILGLGANEQGVDSPGRTDIEQRTRAASALAGMFCCTVLLTGETDVVSDARRSCAVSGGSGMMPYITGSGCMLSVLCGAFLAVAGDAYFAAATASAYWKRCSERAEIAAGGRGPGSLRQALMDAAYAMTDETLASGASIEEL
ncbi:MAG TPA: hydroxyethylthiazole kinase [Candidatus Scatomorpha gallistercoris]|nr:hydroxyethylthiazole kinase [Candidatus Scatomorpha gallistercoris]